MFLRKTLVAEFVCKGSKDAGSHEEECIMGETLLIIFFFAIVTLGDITINTGDIIIGSKNRKNDKKDK